MFNSYNHLTRQYIAVLTVNLCSICVGMGLAWPSPVLVKLMDPNQTVLSNTLTCDEASWIVSAGYVSVGFSSYLGGLAMDAFGRKFCIVICMFSKILTELFILFSTEVWMLVFGRVTCCILQSSLLCCISAYTAEISSKEIRGSLLSILGISVSFGILLMYCFGPYLSYSHLSIANTTIVIGCAIPMLFVLESPYYLFSKGRLEECTKVLTYFKESDQRVKEELKQYNIGTNKNSKITKNKAFLKSMTTSILFSMLIQMAGQPIILNYLQLIMEMTDTKIKSQTTSVIAGIIQFISGILGALLIDKIDRKIIFGVSLVGSAVGLTGLGAFFRLKEVDICEDWINYFPLLSMAIVMLCCSIGSNGLLMVIVSELFEGPARATGITTSVSINGFTSFFLTKYFTLLTQTVGHAYSFWILTFNNIVTFLFVIFFVPETKGKTFGEIQRALNNKEKSCINFNA